MARLKVYKDNYIETTAVSNCFIDNYMQDANDAQLKVYLYLIRMIGANLSTSVSDIADKFNHTEKDVLRALKFWEKKKLLSLDFDENKNLVGIHLCHLSSTEYPTGTALNLQAKNEPDPITQFTVSVEPAGVMPVAGVAAPTPSGVAGTSSVTTTIPTAPTSAVNTFEEEVVPDPFAKPVYSADQLKAFRAKEETQQLLFAAQMYIGRPMTSTDMKTILFISDVLHFSDDLIDYLIQYCVDREKKDFRYIEKVAINWAEQGITTVKQAKKVSLKYDKNVYAIMNALGKSSSPTQKEVEFINRWMKEYAFTQDIILEACDRTVLATDKHRFEYAEGILSKWFQSGIHHKTDIQKLDEQFTQKKPSTPAPFAGSSNNKFNQFQQNSYDFDDLEKKLLSN